MLRILRASRRTASRPGRLIHEKDAVRLTAQPTVDELLAGREAPPLWRTLSQAEAAPTVRPVREGRATTQAVAAADADTWCRYVPIPSVLLAHAAAVGSGLGMVQRALLDPHADPNARTRSGIPCLMGESGIKTLAWRLPIDEWLAGMGRRIYRSAAFDYGLIGFEVSGEDLPATDDHERYISCLVPVEGDVRYLAATR